MAMIGNTCAIIRHKLRLIVCCFLLFSDAGLLAQSTPIRFHTDDGFDGGTVLPSGIETQDRRAALLALPIARLAEEDWEGNWGFPLEGIQLSFRLEKYTYEVGEPMKALVLLRNVSEKTIEWRGSAGAENECLFAISREGGTWVERRKANPWFTDISGRPTVILPQAQVAYWIRLDLVYDLMTPGNYGLYVAYNIPRRAESGAVEIRSSSARLKILPAKNANLMSTELKERIEAHERNKKLQGVIDTKYPKPEVKHKLTERLLPPKENAVPVLNSPSASVAAPIAVDVSSPVGATSKASRSSTLVFWSATLACFALVGYVLLRAKRRKTAKH